MKILAKNLASRLMATPCLVCLAVPALRRGFCAACEEELPWQPPGCLLCGVALAAPWSETSPAILIASQSGRAEQPHGAGKVCSRCSYQPPTFTQCHCTFAYEAPISGMIRHFKDRAGFPEFRGLSNCFNEHFMQHYDDTESPLPDLLLPVPLHSSRLRARGYNQALLLARRLSRRTGIPVLANSCQRRHSGNSQRGLNAAERLYNMQGMFGPQACAALTPGQRLAIVDDVVTTTATTQAMAAVMHERGAVRIDVWALARSNHQPDG